MIELTVQKATDSGWIPSKKDFSAWLGAATPAGRSDTAVTIRIVDAEESRALNSRYRKQDSATNVLAFPVDTPGEISVPDVGDIVICAPLVGQEAVEQGKVLMHHWAHLVIHGFLHLQGYDHLSPDEAGVMEACEIAILGELGIPDPYSG